MSRDSGQPSQPAWQEYFTAARTTVLCLLVLLIGRCFLIEPSHISTGSMAPQRLGFHRDWVCPNCQVGFAVGVRLDGSSPVPVCPNCGFRIDPTKATPPVSDGERLWVMKQAFDFLQPERWQDVVFYSPDDPATPHLKRVAGLPGETIQIRQGDLFVNGQRAAKGESARKDLSVKVYDQKYVAADVKRYPRWKFIGTETGGQWADGGWEIIAGGRSLVYSSKRQPDQELNDYQWANYWHFCPVRGAYGPVTDFLAYEGREFGAEHVVSDLWFRARIEAQGCEWVALRLCADDVQIVVELPWSNAGKHDGRPVVRLNGQAIQEISYKSFNTIRLQDVQVELSWVDHRLECLLDGEPVFEPLKLENLPEQPPSIRYRETPVGFGIRGEQARIRDFQLYRDVYITDRPATDPLVGHAVRESVKLPADGFFLLGDNSGYSIDSRFWRNGPVVPRSALIGRPLGRSNREQDD